MERTYAQFVEFVKAQPADKPIKHHLGWAGCAVGEFCKGDQYEAEEFALDVIDVENEDLAKSLMVVPTACERFPDYGALAEAL